jgi:hypothetical protein
MAHNLTRLRRSKRGPRSQGGRAVLLRATRPARRAIRLRLQARRVIGMPGRLAALMVCLRVRAGQRPSRSRVWLTASEAGPWRRHGRG